MCNKMADTERNCDMSVMNFQRCVNGNQRERPKMLTQRSRMLKVDLLIIRRGHA